MNRKLSRKKPHREHMIKNIATSLVLYEVVDTTAAKAKEVKSYVDKVIARNKSNDLSAKRRVIAALSDNNASKKLINELLPRYEGRNSGFTKSYHLKNRAGDNAEMMRLELVDKKSFKEDEKIETEKVKAPKAEAKKPKELKAKIDKEVKNDK